MSVVVSVLLWTVSWIHFVIGTTLVLLLGAIFGLFQWIALRRHSARAARWIGANALGWALALPWSYVAGASAHERGAASALSVAAGVAMGLTLALVTGVFLRGIVRGPRLDRRNLAMIGGGV